MQIPSTMQAMMLDAPHTPLVLRTIPVPTPESTQVLIRVRACGVCRTDLHVVDGELTKPKLPLVPGHEIVGEVVAFGTEVRGLTVGARVGVPWLGYTCGQCRFCRTDRENLCDNARFTGYEINGGYAQYTVADSRFCFVLPELKLDDAHWTPLLCAGLIGYRSLRLAGDAKTLGLYGFGAAAHIVAQIARSRGQRVFGFTRPGDSAGQAFALRMGAEWSGDSDKPAPETLDAAIIFAPVGSLVPLALRAVSKGGVVVCAGIHMSDIPPFSYDILWGERVVRSVANLTRGDGRDLMKFASEHPLETEITHFPLPQANEALAALRNGVVTGAAVLLPG